MVDRYESLLTRVERLERRVRRWQAIAVLTAAAAGSAALVTACKSRDAGNRPLSLKSDDGTQSIELTAGGLIVVGAGGGRTAIEGGMVSIDASNRHAELVASEAEAALRLSVTGAPRVAPEISLQVGDGKTPASLLMSDRKARNFNHLYINGTAGLEMAGVKEYKNLATP